MNKEEKKYNNHTRNQRRMFRIKKQEEKINDLKLLVGNLQSKLDNANNKIEEIKEYCNEKLKWDRDDGNDYWAGKNNVQQQVSKDILSIIGGE